jgi:hypothetical protein
VCSSLLRLIYKSILFKSGRHSINQPDLIYELLEKKCYGQALFCEKEVSLALEAKGARLC